MLKGSGLMVKVGLASYLTNRAGRIIKSLILQSTYVPTLSQSFLYRRVLGDPYIYIHPLI